MQIFLGLCLLGMQTIAAGQVLCSPAFLTEISGWVGASFAFSGCWGKRCAIIGFLVMKDLIVVVGAGWLKKTVCHSNVVVI